MHLSGAKHVVVDPSIDALPDDELAYESRLQILLARERRYRVGPVGKERIGVAEIAVIVGGDPDLHRHLRSRAESRERGVGRASIHPGTPVLHRLALFSDALQCRARRHVEQAEAVVPLVIPERQIQQILGHPAVLVVECLANLFEVTVAVDGLQHGIQLGAILRPDTAVERGRGADGRQAQS